MDTRQQSSPAAPAGARPAEAFEQLDSALRVVPLRRWLVLAVAGLTLAAFAVFAVFYRVPLKVEGRGIILAKSVGEADPLLQVTAPAAGRLSRVEVQIGSIVKPGDLLATIDQGELHDQIEEARAEVTRLEDEDRELTRLDTAEAKSKAEALGRLQLTLDRNLELDQGRLALNRQISASDSVLKKRGFLNNIDALKSRADADAVESSVGAITARLQELEYDRVEDDTRRRGARLKRELGIRAAKTKLGLLEARLARDTRVVSPFPSAGKVVDLMITQHALVEKGAPVALLRPLSEAERPLEAIVFVPAGMGKKVRVGDKVEVSPDTVRRYEHGYILGRVVTVSEIPATEMAMLAELKHKTLVGSFLERYSGQVLLSLHVELIENKDEAPEGRPGLENRLKWSSVSGSGQRLSNGTLCGAEVVVDSRPLIALALPWVRQIMGL